MMFDKAFNYVHELADYAALVVNDFEGFYKQKFPKWKRELKYLREILEQGYTIAQIDEMESHEYARFRENSRLFNYYKKDQNLDGRSTAFRADTAGNITRTNVY